MRAEPLRFKKDGVYGVVSIMFSLVCHIFECFTDIEYLTFLKYFIALIDIQLFFLTMGNDVYTGQRCIFTMVQCIQIPCSECKAT